jgi:PAS domain S-box-containing protein
MELRDFFDNAADGVLVVDDTDHVIYWNDSAIEILGYKREDAVGKRCYEVLKGLGERGSAVCGPDCTMKTCAFRGEKIHNFNLLTAHKDGRTIWMNMSTMCARGFDGRDTVVVHMFRDVDRLQRSSDLVGEFMVRVAEVGVPVGAPLKAAPGDGLTAREEEVLALLGEGLSSKQIAARLTISEATARNHIQSILSKLGVHSRLEAALYARERRGGG